MYMYMYIYIYMYTQDATPECCPQVLNEILTTSGAGGL